ncbi:MAG: hypothetical protein U0T69_03495 [Chitinophagales bacterium]
MKNIILILLSCIYILCNAQNTKGSKTQAPSSSDIQKMMDDAMKNLSPEEQQMAKDMFKNMSPQIDNAVNAKPTGNSTTPSASSIGTKTAKIIGPEGGEIKSGNGKITLKFPAGAVSKKTEISIEEITAISEVALGNSFLLEPEGLQFEVPVKLSFTYSENDLQQSSVTDLTIINDGGDGILYENLLTSLDTVYKKISTDISHFSKWSMASRLKLYISPKECNLNKGKSIKLSIGFHKIDPVKNKKDLISKLNKLQKEGQNEKEIEDLQKDILFTQSSFENLAEDENDIRSYTDLYKKLKEQLNSRNVKSEKEKGDLKTKISKIEKELYLTPDANIAIITNFKDLNDISLTVNNWKLESIKAPINNKYGSLVPETGLKTATYTAPKTLPSDKKSVIVYASVTAQNKSHKPVNYLLLSKINLMDSSTGYLNYTFDGKETKTLEFGYSTQYQNIVKKDVDKALNETPVAQAIYSDGKLIIHTTSSALVPMNASNLEGLSFTIKNPKIGKNALLCDDEIGYPREGYGNTSPGQIEFILKGVNSEHFNNVLTKRWGNPSDCNDKDECVTFELNLTEFDLKTKKISGTFSGKVFEDRPAKKACADSYQHILSGEFSLTMITNPTESFDTPVYDPKNRPSEQYDKPESKPESSSTPSDDDDLKPLKPSPKPKPKPKPKTNNDEIKPFE